MLAAISVVLPSRLCAQDSTHVITVKKRAPGKSLQEIFDGRFTVAPHYTSEMGLGVAMSYTCSSPIAIVGNFTTRGYMLLGLTGSGLTKGKKWSYSYNAFYNYAPSYFWGLGYEAADASGNRSRYDHKRLQLQGEMLYRFTGRFSAGPSIGYDRILWEKFPAGDISSSLANYGIVARYDSMDRGDNPSRGVDALLRQRNWSNLSGSTSLQLRGYGRVWDGGILAAELYSILTYGDMELTMLPSIGGSERMRGYYYGRYRNNNIVSGQVELRQRIWEMVTGAVWGGFANLWGDYGKFDWKHTLPNYGVGARYYITEGLCLRMDYGFGKRGQNAFIFSINEAF